MTHPRFWKLTNLTATFIIGAAGVITYGSGLANQFVGDDFAQVLNNAPVHSLSGIPGFFAGSTFYSSATQAHLAGVYYRPLMTTTFDLLYRLVGPHAYGFHLLQLLVYLGASVLLFLVLKHFLRPGLALALALIFVVHPINSQSVYSIADLQEPLYFGFGLLALWLLLRFRGRPQFTVVLAAACLLLSMLAKETGLLFGAMTLLYAFAFNRRRLAAVAAWSALALAIYLALKIPAVGLVSNPGNAPIDHLSLAGRLLNLPALWVFYLGKFVFPWHIAHAYYWVVRGPSLTQFWLPLALILVLAGLMIAAGRAVRKITPRGFQTYVFFAVWFVLGLLFHSQIAPLDLTAAIAWFMFPLVGLLGLIGVLFQTFLLGFLLQPILRRWAVGVVTLIIVLLAARSAVRARDWSDTYTLAARDLSVSSQDYESANLLAFHLEHLGQFRPAEPLAEQSVAVLPTADNLDTLGVAEAGLSRYPAAAADYQRSLDLAVTRPALEHRAQLTAVYGDPAANLRLLDRAIATLPQDSPIWFYLAVADARAGDAHAAQSAANHIQAAADPNPAVTAAILAGQPFALTIDPRPQ